MADKSKMPENYGVYASGLTDASGTPFTSIKIRRGTEDTPYFESRQVYVGDTLPQGNVTEITAEGIRVIPDEGDEYLLPVGSGARVDYSGRKKTPDRSYLDDREAIDLDAAPIKDQLEFDADALRDIAEQTNAYASFKDQIQPFYEMMRNPEITDEDVIRELAKIKSAGLLSEPELTEDGKYRLKPFPSGFQTAMEMMDSMEVREPLPYIELED